MSYLEKAKQALVAQAVAVASPRCSRCLALGAAGVAVLACPCGYAGRASGPERKVVDRAGYRQALRVSRRRSRERGQLRLVEVSEDD